MNWKELCEAFGGKYRNIMDLSNNLIEVCEVNNKDAFESLVSALKYLASSRKYKELKYGLAVSGFFEKGLVDYKSWAKLSKDGTFTVEVNVERVLYPAELVWDVAAEMGVPKEEVEKAIEEFLKEGAKLKNKMNTLWIRDMSKCETELGGEYNSFIARCSIDIPEQMVNIDNLDLAFNELTNAVNDAEIPMPQLQQWLEEESVKLKTS